MVFVEAVEVLKQVEVQTPELEVVKSDGESAAAVVAVAAVVSGPVASSVLLVVVVAA